MPYAIEITAELRPKAETIIDFILATNNAADICSTHGRDHLRAHLLTKMACTGKIHSMWPYDDNSHRCSRAHSWLEDVSAGYLLGFTKGQIKITDEGYVYAPADGVNA